MKTTYENIVLGLGGIGSAAVYWLSRRAGKEVLGLEQFEIGHVRGGSQDHSRIIRLSYHTPHYVELAKQAYAAWAELEADADELLIVKTGGLDLSPADARIPISDYTESLTAAHVPFEWLTADETMYRWPQFRLTEDIHAIYQAESGIAPPIKANAAYLRLAQRYGATLRDQAPVTDIQNHNGIIAVTAGGITYQCRKLIIAAGAWSNPMLAYFGTHLPLTVTQEQVTYYDTPHAADFLPDRFPVWIWMDEPCFYGFPVYGERGPKVAQDVGGEVVTAETRTFEPNPATLARTEAFVRQTLPTMLGTPIYTKSCLYTMPPDRDFVLDTLPEHPNVCIAIGAGHAYKFASLLGKILSELALDGEPEVASGRTPHNLSPFKINRPILLQANPPTSFMV